MDDALKQQGLENSEGDRAEEEDVAKAASPEASNDAEAVDGDGAETVDGDDVSFCC